MLNVFAILSVSASMQRKWDGGLHLFFHQWDGFLFISVSILSAQYDSNSVILEEKLAQTYSIYGIFQ